MNRPQTLGHRLRRRRRLRKYTVILRYPDYRRQNDDEIFVDWVEADCLENAVHQVRRKAAITPENDRAIEDPTDFALIGVVAGYHKIQAP